MTKDSQATASDRLWRALAWLIWVVPMVVFAVMVITRPGSRTVVPLYQEAVQNWWHRQPLYHGPAGMNYLPHFVVLFSPYELLGRALAEILWRGTAAAGLAAGLWLFCGAKGGPDRVRTFVIVSAITLPLCLPALQFGQANAHLGAALLLAAWCLRAQRWSAAVVLLWLATCVKPLGLAAMGLAWAAYPQLWWRLALGLPVFVGLPFLFAPPGYALSQYVGAWENLRQCSEVTEHRFADLNGLLRTFGTALTGAASLAARALAGGALMLVCWRASRRETRTAPVADLAGLRGGFPDAVQSHVRGKQLRNPGPGAGADGVVDFQFRSETHRLAVRRDGADDGFAARTAPSAVWQPLRARVASGDDDCLSGHHRVTGMQTGRRGNGLDALRRT